MTNKLFVFYCLLYLLGLFELFLQISLLLLHFVLPLLKLLQLNLVFLKLLQLGLVLRPLHLQRLQLLLQVLHLTTQRLLLLDTGRRRGSVKRTDGRKSSNLISFNALVEQDVEIITHFNKVKALQDTKGGFNLTLLLQFFIL